MPSLYPRQKIIIMIDEYPNKEHFDEPSWRDIIRGRLETGEFEECNMCGLIIRAALNAGSTIKPEVSFNRTRTFGFINGRPC